MSNDKPLGKRKIELTSEENFKKSLYLRSIPRIQVIPSGDCIPT